MPSVRTRGREEREGLRKSRGSIPKVECAHQEAKTQKSAPYCVNDRIVVTAAHRRIRVRDYGHAGNIRAGPRQRMVDATIKNEAIVKAGQ